MHIRKAYTLKELIRCKYRKQDRYINILGLCGGLMKVRNMLLSISNVPGCRIPTTKEININSDTFAISLPRLRMDALLTPLDDGYNVSISYKHEFVPVLATDYDFNAVYLYVQLIENGDTCFISYEYDTSLDYDKCLTIQSLARIYATAIGYLIRDIMNSYNIFFLDTEK